MADPSLSVMQAGFPVWQGWDVVWSWLLSPGPGPGWRRQVVGEPAVSCPEGLGPGGLGAPHDAEPVAEGLEGDYFVVPDPEPLLAPGEVDVLGREPEHPGVGVYRLLPLYGPAAEGAGPVVEAPGDPDAEVLGGAAALPAHDCLQVVNSLDHPYELLRLHQVEGDGSIHALSLWDDALGDVPDHRGLHEAGMDAVLVQSLLGQGEIVRILGQGVLLVQGEEAVLEGPLDGRFPSPDEETVGFTLARLSDAEGQVLEVAVPVPD